MRFKKTNEPLILLKLHDNLWGDFTIGWNPVISNTLGVRLVNGSIDGLTQIDPRLVNVLTIYALGLLFLKAWITFWIIRFYLLRAFSTCASKKCSTLIFAINTKQKWTMLDFLGACFARIPSSRHFFYKVRYYFSIEEPHTQVPHARGNPMKISSSITRKTGPRQVCAIHGKITPYSKNARKDIKPRGEIPGNLGEATPYINGKIKFS